MKFVDAVRYLKSQGVVIVPAKKRGRYGRFYKVWDPTSEVPPMWCTPKSVCSLAKLAYFANNDNKEKQDEVVRNFPV